jgi:hypothetical protein
MKNNERSIVTNYSKLSLDALKLKAQDLKIKGRSKMNKAELLAAVNAATETPAKPAESFIDGIKAAFANEREARSNKGREAGKGGTVTLKTRPEDKALAYRLQRGSQSAKLTGKQSKRVRKTEAKLMNRSRQNVCSGMGVPLLTYA